MREVYQNEEEANVVDDHAGSDGQGKGREGCSQRPLEEEVRRVPGQGPL